MKLSIISFVLIIGLAGCWWGSSSITAVEHGLRYKILIAGEKNEHMPLAERMIHYKVPAVSIAVINNDKLEWAKGYGCISPDETKKIDTNTLFQAASISKPVTALGALLLVQQGKLSLDENVNTYLKSWKVPENKFTKKEKVTLRRLLSHTAGTSVSGFPGYSSDTPIPSVIEILHGKQPRVNTDPIIVTEVPGKEHRYSGGGTTIIQLLIEDVTGERFDTWMHKNILVPFGMHASTFSQPLPQPYSDIAAHGHDDKGKPIAGRWHTYPMMAPAGLWTTPTDLAHFLVAILKTLHGKQTGPVNQELIEEALKPQFNDLKNEKTNGGVGLGFFFRGTGDAMFFCHGGSNEGFKADMMAWPKLGKGLIIMTNGDQGAYLINEIINGITDTYHIPGNEPKIKSTIKMDPVLYGKFTGVYKDGEHTFTVNMRDNKLFALDSYLSHEMQIYPEKEDTFFTREGSIFSLQLLSTHGQIDSIILFDNDGKRVKDKNGDIVLKRSKE